MGIMRRFLLLAALFLLLGCPSIWPGGEDAPQAEPPDYSYDLFVKEISTVPAYPRLTENYTMRTQVQIYGRHIPSSYSIWILDGNQTLFNETIASPQSLSHYDFPFYADSTQAHHIRVEVLSLDSEHPEPQENLGNNVLRKDAKAYPLGYYDLYNWSITWFYDAVGMQVKQAQAFTLDVPINASEISVYVQAMVPCPPSSKLIISLHEPPNNWGNIGVGKELLRGEIDASLIGGSPSWQSISFNKTELQNGTYWIALEFYSPSSAGVEWYRVEGNPFGGVYDTQMLDIAGYGEWEYKGFDFAFRVE
ncbi:hypothetical protein JW721_02250 [Candidatus Micrarchaeota archaeon]|nr:hypothetical protein [Candidatus Micrarchaeota archaeon]